MSMRTDVYDLAKPLGMTVVSLCMPAVAVTREDGTVCPQHATVKVAKLMGDAWAVGVFPRIDIPLRCWITTAPARPGGAEGRGAE